MDMFTVVEITQTIKIKNRFKPYRNRKSMVTTNESTGAIVPKRVPTPILKALYADQTTNGKFKHDLMTKEIQKNNNLCTDCRRFKYGIKW